MTTKIAIATTPVVITVLHMADLSLAAYSKEGSVAEYIYLHQTSYHQSSLHCRKEHLSES
jgi:hypothetical protein